MKGSVLIVAERSHPNLRYLAQSIQELGGCFSVKLAFNKVTPDFDTTSLGCDIYQIEELTRGDQTDLFDFVIIRYENNRPPCPLSLLRPLGRQIIQMDEEPVGSRPTHLLKQFIKFLYRLVRSDPILRISPRLYKPASSAGGWQSPIDGFFFFPGPSESTTDKLVKRKNKAARPAHKIVTISKSFQARKRCSVLVSALEFVESEVSLTVIRSDPSYVGGRNISDLDRIEEKRLREALSRTRKTRNLENLRHPEILEQLCDADLYVLVSSREPFSISNLEASSLGVFCLLSEDNGSISAMPEGSFKTVPSDISARDLAKVIDDLLKQRHLWNVQQIRSRFYEDRRRAGLFQLLNQSRKFLKD